MRTSAGVALLLHSLVWVTKHQRVILMMEEMQYEQVVVMSELIHVVQVIHVRPEHSDR